jgi:hypothetical protein
LGVGDILRFKYILNGSGWAEGFIEVNSQKCEFNPSYLTDALGDLLEGLVEVTFNTNHKQRHFNTVFFDWDEEPNGLEWMLAPLEDGKVSIKIKSFDDISSKDNEQGIYVLNSVCNLKDLTEEIIKEVDSLIKNHGVVGYKESWVNHEFPLGSFLKLKHYLKENKKIELDYIEGENKGYGGYYKSALSTELTLLTDKFD